MRPLLVALMLALPAFAAASRPAVDAPPAEAAAATTDPTEAWRALLAARRATNIARLRAYADAGVFPRNVQQPGMLSLFLDEEGRPCAMAHLIQASGHDDLVRRTAEQDNHVQLGAVADGPLLAWILTSGLTQEEAALVQEPDMFLGGLDDPAVQQVVLEAEVDRLRAHFHAAALQLEARSDVGLETALSRLGERARTAPPAE